MSRVRQLNSLFQYSPNSSGAMFNPCDSRDNYTLLSCQWVGNVTKPRDPVKSLCILLEDTQIQTIDQTSAR